ncbi:MAG: hypothetical protein DRI81_13005 [Chloroflexi bacterium]|nr:MAG: hypothetical protein DRI81_13005 [Chloroflexota bacterium]
MPWIEGPTWMETMIQKQALTPEESLTLARSLAGILTEMEEKGLAHCDLSGPNVILPPKGGVVLVDVEEMYGAEFEQPEALPSGTSGYGHRTAGEGLWGPDADRFAGAVLLAEMLGWCDERVREAAWGEQYFDKDEVQRGGDRYRLLVEALRDRWGERAAALFERAWRSETLQDCPTFGEWLVTLPEDVPAVETVAAAVTAGGVESEKKIAVGAAQALMDLARRFEEQDNPASALQTYRQAQALAPAGSEVAVELARIVQEMKTQQAQAAVLAFEPLEGAVEPQPATPAPRAALEVEPALIEQEAGEKPAPLSPAPQAALEAELALIEQQGAGGETTPPLAERAAAAAPLPPAPQAALEAELALIEQREEPTAPGPELLPEEKAAPLPPVPQAALEAEPALIEQQAERKELAAEETEAARAVPPLPRRRVPRWAWALGGLGVLVLVLGGLAVMDAVPSGELGSEGRPIIWTFVPMGETGRVTDLLHEETGLFFDIKVATEYAGAIEAMCANPPEAHMSSLNTFAYVAAADRGCAEAALLSVRYGSPTYNGQFIVRADSGITDISQLAGKTFCRPDPLSTSGWVIPSIMMKAAGVDPDNDLAEIVDAGSHDAVAAAVDNGDCDVGATYVDARSRIEEDYPDVMEQTVVIAVEPDIPNDGVQFQTSVPQELRDQIVAGLLAIAATDEGVEALDTALGTAYWWEGLVEADDSYYDGFRQILQAAGISTEDLVGP